MANAKQLWKRMIHSEAETNGGDIAIRFLAAKCICPFAISIRHASIFL